MKQIVALSVVGAIASAEAFAPAFGGQQLVQRRGAVAMRSPNTSLRIARASGMRMQEQGSDEMKVEKKEGESASLSAMAAVLDTPKDTAVASVDKPAAAAAAKPEPAIEKQDEPAATPAAATPAPVAAKPPPAPAAKVTGKAEEAAKKVDPNEFAMMALKAGALKQSSPLIMSEMAGNKGFDPAGFAKSPDLLLQYREAELKHARLAMLASVGWVMSELLHTPISDLLGAQNLLQEDKAEFLAKAPSVLNGGLMNVPPFFWVATAMMTGAVEAWRMLSISEV